jgi:hypothetical protein
MGRWKAGCLLRREGETIPLHDHPNMHGIIKCLEGRIRVTSFTRKVKLEFHSFSLLLFLHGEGRGGSIDPGNEVSLDNLLLTLIGSADESSKSKFIAITFPFNWDSVNYWYL